MRALHDPSDRHPVTSAVDKNVTAAARRTPLLARVRVIPLRPCPRRGRPRVVSVTELLLARLLFAPAPMPSASRDVAELGRETLDISHVSAAIVPGLLRLYVDGTEPRRTRTGANHADSSIATAADSGAGARLTTPC